MESEKVKQSLADDVVIKPATFEKIQRIILLNSMRINHFN